VAVVLVVLLGLALAFFCIRRRRRSAGKHTRDGSVSVPLAGHHAEKPFAVNNVASTRPRSPVLPAIVARHNSTYFTGLDMDNSGRNSPRSTRRSLSQRLSGGYGVFNDPPPPYKDKEVASPAGGDARSARSSIVPHQDDAMMLATIPHHPPAPAPTHRSPFDDPVPSPTDRDRDVVSPLSTSSTIQPIGAARPIPSRTNTNRTYRSAHSHQSFTSTQYSDTASVHSARAQRVSIIAPLNTSSPAASTHSARSYNSFGRPAARSSELPEELIGMAPAEPAIVSAQPRLASSPASSRAPRREEDENPFHDPLPSGPGSPVSYLRPESPVSPVSTISSLGSGRSGRSYVVVRSSEDR
jgi:hypothetical protein